MYIKPVVVDRPSSSLVFLNHHRCLFLQCALFPHPSVNDQPCDCYVCLRAVIALALNPSPFADLFAHGAQSPSFVAIIRIYARPTSTHVMRRFYIECFPGEGRCIAKVITFTQPSPFIEAEFSIYYNQNVIIRERFPPEHVDHWNYLLIKIVLDFGASPPDLA